MAELKSNAKKVPASAPSVKSRGAKKLNKSMGVGKPEPKKIEASKSLEEAFAGKDKPGK